MPRGDKSKYSEKERRMAEHIEESEIKRGKSEKVAARSEYPSERRKQASNY
jgi:hypothetical protein